MKVSSPKNLSLHITNLNMNHVTKIYQALISDSPFKSCNKLPIGRMCVGDQI